MACLPAGSLINHWSQLATCRQIGSPASSRRSAQSRRTPQSGWGATSTRSDASTGCLIAPVSPFARGEATRRRPYCRTTSTPRRVGSALSPLSNRQMDCIKPSRKQIALRRSRDGNHPAFHPLGAIVFTDYSGNVTHNACDRIASRMAYRMRTRRVWSWPFSIFGQTDREPVRIALLSVMVPARGDLYSLTPFQTPR